MKNRKLILEYLKAIFQNETPNYLTGRELCDHPDDPEAYKEVASFENLRWEIIDSDFWHGRESAISYLSPSACCYYIPSVIYSYYEDNSGIDLIFSSLIHEWSAKEEALVNRRNRRWMGLTQSQRVCLSGWLVEVEFRGVISIARPENVKQSLNFLLGSPLG